MTRPLLLNFCEVPGWPGVRCTRDGQIMGRSGKVLKPYVGEKGGHLYVLIRNKRLRVHHAVLLTYIGPRPTGLMGLHADDNPKNNSVENLSWGTSLDNAADRRRNRGFPTGQNAPGARLTAAQVAMIRCDARPSRVVAADYGVSHTSILEIRRGNRWVA